MQAIDLLCEGTMKAGSMMVNQTNTFPKLKALRDTNLDKYASLVSGAMRQTLRADLKTIMAEWKDAIDAHMPESMLKMIVNTQCNKEALDALRMIEEEL